MSTSELVWFKSSYSSSGDGDCVEVALAWHKSSYSSSGSGDCVEVAVTPATVHLRDSKAPEENHLRLSPEAWGLFVSFASGTSG
ncbi:DUF397 domain-containing protein [Streptomyces sp. NPDC006385]|uniref:DUF397 domain-containing protein n=1 Tax=Streptomyces sp. NPDC006385 TaxID=3156761 RepID=UPI0033AB5A2B